MATPSDNDTAFTIRPANDDDALLIAEWLNRKDIKQYLSSNIRVNEIKDNIIKVTSKRQDQAWSLIVMDDKPVGLLVMDEYDPVDKICNLWYVMGDTNYQGKSIMPAAINALLEKPPLEVNVVTAWVGSVNEASIRCLEKAGFRTVGTIAGAFHVDGGNYDRVLFEKQI